MKKILFLCLLFAVDIFGQTYIYRTGATTYFRDADGDTNFVWNDSGILIGGWNTTEASLSRGSGVFKALVVQDDSVDSHVLSLSVAGSLTNIYSNKTGGATAYPLVFGVGGTEYMRLVSTKGLLLGFDTHEASLSNYSITALGTINIASDTTDASIFGMSIAGSASNLYSNTTGSGTALPIKIYVGGTEYAKLRTDGWFERLEYKDWDAIAWFSPADSGAVLDTTNNVLEVLDFYDSTDSTYAYNTWQLPPWFNAIDSFKIYIEAPTSNGDSSAWILSERHYADTESRSGATWTVVDTAYIDHSNASANDILSAAWTSGFSGMAADDIMDFRLRRENTVLTTNEAAAIPLRRTRIYYK